MNKKVKLFFFVIVAMLSIFGCGNLKGESTSEQTKQEEKDTTTSQIDEVTVQGMVEDILKNMTLEEKIGQLFIVNLDTLDPNDDNEERKLTDNMKKSIEKYHVGGIVLFARDINTRKQTKQLNSDLQDASKIPMFISVDEEGGTVARISSNEKMKTTSFPDMSEIGKTKDEKKAYEVGKTIGNDISKLGFNLDFAPVADVLSNEKNVEIGVRSFGSDPELVAKMVASEVRGLQEENVSATLKHFPGHGDVSLDTHKGYVASDNGIKTLRKREFLPFKAGIDEGCDFIMVSHININKVTQNETPSSLSKLVIKEILRGELGFEKIIITDAMNMQAITKFYEDEEAAVMAIKAGNDMILMPNDLKSAFEGIREAVEEGEIEEKEIDEAVKRILSVKLERNVISEDTTLIEK
ncbi:MAG: glycoside hydrolase family 3 protein [Lachnospiraceae bacterium]